MKYLIISILLISQAIASIDNIKSFEADFTQTITDDKDKVLLYSGHVQASKPQFAKWSYKKPVDKEIYISPFIVTIVEPEIEQVIQRKVESNFNFFQMVRNAKKIEENTYEARYKNSIFTIIKDKDLIKSISYIDEFENDVIMTFENQKQNHKIPLEVFTPKYPLYFDIVRD